ncbi:MAG: NADH-quinone oxidoreductase subunit L [candidate division Zixibacteria bacterium]|nr:NADH-quinone oxidoreductase subunit L [candidate division Zixibacteria bacterium]
MLDYIWLIVVMPLLGFLINGLFGKKFPRAMVSLIACGTVLVSFIMSVIALFELLQLDPHHRYHEIYSLFKWIPSGALNVEIGFLFDPLSAVMALVVSGVGFLIHVYSIGYMSHDKDYSRFFTYMNLFTGSMLLLVLANNFLLLFVGWEGVGLCSYLLIGFWYTRQSAANAGMKAFIVNRIGDFGFLLGMMLIFWTFGSLNFHEVFNSAFGFFHSMHGTGGEEVVLKDVLGLGMGTFTLITIFLFIGATGKSAQIPLYVWLPDAMEGPTPVSALIHAATMVTAGVYMVARCNVLYLLAPDTLMLVAIIGAATAFFAATMGVAQNDIKRVLAYSTVSQLGYMFLACGVAAFGAGIFHLMTHAFFKALLFLAAGSVIHGMSEIQDMRRMGGLKSKMPATFITMLLATLAISGIPLFSGFFSKDEILWKSFSSDYGGIVFWIIGLVTAGITAFYMFRLIYLTFYGKNRAPEDVQHNIHESPKSMTVPLMILAFLAVVGGWVGIPPALGGGAWFEHFLHPVFAQGEEIMAHGHHPEGFTMEYILMAASVVLVLISIFVAYTLYRKKPEIAANLREKFSGLHKVVYNKYFVDEFYQGAVVKPLVGLSFFLWKVFDVVVIDGLANGLAYMIKSFSSGGRKIQTGFLRNYLLIFVLGVVVFLAYVVLR